MNYWLMKSEPNIFSIDDLAKRPNQTEPWNGVRNYQVRNWLRDEFKVGDQAFFYHSSCETPGVVGIIEIVKAGYPEVSPWYCVDVKLIRKFKRLISLTEIRQHPALRNMRLLQKGSRLSITPVTMEEWKVILALE